MPETNNTTPSNGFIMGEGLYKTMKWIAMVLIPAISSLYFGLSGIWNLPNATQVVGTLALVDTFLGVLLGISTSSYNKSEANYDGVMTVAVNDKGTKVHLLEFNDEETAHNLELLPSVRFKVNANLQNGSPE